MFFFVNSPEVVSRYIFALPVHEPPGVQRTASCTGTSDKNLERGQHLCKLDVYAVQQSLFVCVYAIYVLSESFRQPWHAQGGGSTATSFSVSPSGSQGNFRTESWSPPFVA